MIINQYYNFYTNEVSGKVADELIARMEALSAVNRNVSSFGSSKQFFAVKNRNDAKPELLRRFQEWQHKKIAFAEVRAFRLIPYCCKGQLIKDREQAPFVVTIDYDNENGTVPGSGDGTSGEWESYGNIKYSVANKLNKPSVYNGQPQAFLQSVTISNEGYAGIVQRVTIKMRVFTREAFEIIDKWYLRPGNEMLVKYGWSVPLTSMETATDTIHAVIFNFNATLTDDMGWMVTVYGIAKGNLAVGLALGSAAEETVALNNNTGQTENDTGVDDVVPNLTTILKDEVNKIRRVFSGIEESDKTNIYDSSTDLDSDNRPYGVIYGSDIFPHGIGRVKFAVEKTPDEAGLVPGQSENANSQSLADQIRDSKQHIIAQIDSVREVSNEELENWVNSTLRKNSWFNSIENYYKQRKQPNVLRKSLYTFYGWSGNFGVVNLNKYTNDQFEYAKTSAGMRALQEIGEFFSVSEGAAGDVKPEVWPPIDNLQIIEDFVIGKNDGSEVFAHEPGNLNNLQKAVQDANKYEGGYAGSMQDAARRNLQNATKQAQANQQLLNYRPPKGALRRKILDEIYKEGTSRGTISARDPNIAKMWEQMKTSLQAEKQAIDLSIQTAEKAEQEKILIQQAVRDALPSTIYANARITDAQSTARYFICLGDLVYYFNEKVFKQAPELYNSVQLLVENQPTSYDPNIVSCIPMDVILSNARNNRGGMSSYGLYNSVNYGFKYKKTLKNPGDLQIATGCDGVDFFPHGEFNSFEDMDKHREDWGIYLNESNGEKVAAFNIAHIWVSVDVINQAYMDVLKGRAIDPQYRTIFDFFENIFSKIAQATAGATQLTLIPDNNQLYADKNVDSTKLSLENPLLKKTQLFRIVDNNFQVPHNIPGAPRSFDFKVNDVNATILRDVNISLKLPSKLQTVAYTYGRAGINEDIADIDDSSEGGAGVCKKDFEKLKQKQEDVVAKLTIIKDEVGYNLSQDNLEKLITALGQYVTNPQPAASEALDTTKAVAVHQGWIYSKLYPVELQFKLDGISGFKYGNKVNVLNALPSRYADRIFFTLVKIEHEISNNDWITTLTGIARLKNSHGLLQFPKLIDSAGSKDLCEKIKETKQENVVSANNANVATPTGSTAPQTSNTATTGSASTTTQPAAPENAPVKGKSKVTTTNIPRPNKASPLQTNNNLVVNPMFKANTPITTDPTKKEVIKQGKR